MKYSIVRRISDCVPVLWIRARFQKRMNNAGTSIMSGYMKWRRIIIITRIDARPTPKKFLNDIHTSTVSSPVKWCPIMSITRIHIHALIQKRPDAIQISSRSCVINVHPYFFTGDFFLSPAFDKIRRLIFKGRGLIATREATF